MLRQVAYDEAFERDGTPRPVYREALAVLGARGREAVVDPQGIAVGTGPETRELPLDPVPRIFTAAEWRPLARALAQRARALDAWVADAYGPGRAVRHGVVPQWFLETCPYFEPALPPLDTGIGLVGFDVARRPDGTFAVLEDNVLTPGHAAVPAAREVLTLWRHVLRPPLDVRAPARRLLGGLFAGGRAAILADGAGADASWELRWLSRFLGVPVVDRADGFGVLWQRTAEDRVYDDAGQLSSLGRASLPGLRDGSLRVWSRPGSGVADDKALMPRVADLIRFFCGEEPLLEEVPTAPVLEAAEDPERWVFKPRTGAGARGVSVGKAPDDLHADGWVAQRRVELSVHPTLTADGFEARPVDLRAFAIRTPGGAFEVLPGGVSRFAPAPEGHIVNTSVGGGIKDVWVLAP